MAKVYLVRIHLLLKFADYTDHELLLMLAQRTTQEISWKYEGEDEWMGVTWIIQQRLSRCRHLLWVKGTGRLEMHELYQL